MADTQGQAEGKNRQTVYGLALLEMMEKITRPLINADQRRWKAEDEEAQPEESR